MDSQIKKVIENDMCIGCGGCAYIAPADYKIALSNKGMFKAVSKHAGVVPNINTDLVCPFTDASKNEDTHATDLYPDCDVDDNIGRYRKCYIGHVSQGEFRENGSSGGFGKWLLSKLLIEGEVDFVIQVAESKAEDVIFQYRTFSDPVELISGAKSAYYPITMDGILQHIAEHQGSYAITAVPCFAKAIRNISCIDKVIKERIKYVVGVVCGHLKSTGFAESLAWQAGVHPLKLSKVDFRVKMPDAPANDKGFLAWDSEGRSTGVVSTKKLVGGNWGHNLFKYKACDYCDDVLAETADIAIGDAWIPSAMKDWRGTSVLVVRSERIHQIISKARHDSEIKLQEVGPAEVKLSQEGGLRHRREGLGWRLYQDKVAGRWAPLKRVPPNNNINPKRQRIYANRIKLMEKSHEFLILAKNADDLSIFIKSMRRAINKADGGKLKKILRSLLGPFLRKFSKICMTLICASKV